MSDIGIIAIAAGASIIFSAWATAFAQSKIGTASAGAMAEKPEAAGMLVALQALPEIIVVMGFVTSMMIVGLGKK